MKAYERAMAVAMVAVMVMSAMVCILPTTEGSDETIPIKTVDLSDGQTKISTISVNDKAFDFTKEGDGVKIAYKVEGGGYAELYNYSIKVSDGNPTGSWAAGEGAAVDTVDSDKIKAKLSNTGYNLSVESKSGEPDGEYTFYFEGNDPKTEQSLTIKITVISQGAEQYLEYPFTINVYKAFTSDSKIRYDQASGTVGGTFSTGDDSPGVYYSYTDESNNDPANSDLSNFVFYATGFNKGVGLTDGLKINGSVPENIADTGWVIPSGDNKSKMNLTFVVTDTRTGYMVTIKGVMVEYTLTSGPVVDFEINYTAPGNNVNVEKTTWSEDDAGKTVTIVSNSAENALTISSIYSDNKATVVKTSDDGSTTVDTITLSSSGQPIDISGTGTIQIIVSVDEIDEKKITFIVIDDMIPVNDIDVTCGPVSSS